MSILDNETTETVKKTIIERTKLVVLRTPAEAPQSEYIIDINRHQAIYEDDEFSHTNSDAVAAEAGAPADGTDGTKHAHYPNAKPGLQPVLRYSFGQLAVRTETITYQNASGDDVQVPLGHVPFIVKAAIDFLASECRQSRKTAAINAAIQAVLDAQG